jgi:DNA-binding response OmpR family regulator
MTPRPILIIEDDATLRATLAEQIAMDGNFIAVAAESASEATAKLAEADVRYDAILLDVGLPDADGRDFCAKLRRDGNTTPIIMLTGADAEADVVRGLDAGANDYVAKPFRFAVLLARIRAQLRQHEASEDAVFSVGPYSFRPGSKMLTGANARKVRLTEKETAILRFLYRAGQLPVSRETLLQEVWGYNSGVTTHTLETHIYRLRQKIEKDAANPEILVTEAGGYKLVP